jgi:very-short-patch-repair endonuclease
MPLPDAFARLHRVARRAGQRGYFTSSQAQEAGISRTELARLVAAGSIVRVAPRVYRFRVAAAETWMDHLAVELLSTGGLACGLSATALIDLSRPPPRPQVLVERGRRTATHGRHTTRELAPYERTSVKGMRTLAPVRAVLDAVHRLPPDSATALVESAVVRGLVKPEILRRRARELEHNKRPGCAVTLRILDALHPELAKSRNEWEALVVRRVRELGLPVPELEYEIFVDGRRYILDAAWPAPLVTLEFDGRDPHMRRSVHDYDTGRRNDLTAAGWLRFGITAAALKNGDDRVFAQVARALARRS